jgi:hypothetical protein
MAKELTIIAVKLSSKVSGIKIASMDSEYTLTIMEKNMKEIG